MAEAERKPKCQTCAGQTRRLSCKPFFEACGRDGVIELADQLHRYGHERASAIVDELLIRKWGENGADRVPSAPDIWSVCRMSPGDFLTAPEKIVREASLDCQNCYGDGYEQVATGGAKRCRCGGIPMSNESRLAALHVEMARKTRDQREENELFRRALDAKIV